MSETHDWLVIRDLVMLVRRLIRRVQQHNPDDPVAKQAADYLKRFAYAAEFKNDLLRAAQPIGTGVIDPPIGVES